jgi:L-ascorbate metabolism protein UlaG (beta-lactamase superfamily)
MAGLKNIDIALLPVSGTYVMTAKEAIEAAKVIKPKLAIPMHWGAGVAGTRADAEEFRKGAEAAGVTVQILK